MWSLGFKTPFGAALLVAGVLVGSHDASAQTQTFDHLTCVGVSRDQRLAPMPPPLTLTPEQTEFLTNGGCRPVGGGRTARAQEVCYATAKAPTNPPGGVSLSGQSFLCYRVKCAPNAGGKTEVTIGDQFGDGTILANQRPTTKKLCVPAFIGATPTPTPGATPTPTGAPSATPGQTATPAPTESPVVTPTPTPGSATMAFVDPVANLLQ